MRSFTFFFLLLLYHNCYSQDTLIIKQINGIEVSIYSSANMKDENWKSYGSGITYLPIKIKDVDSVVNCLTEVLNKYPQSLLNENLKKITLFGKMKKKKVDLSGLYVSKYKFYLTMPEFDPVYKRIFEKLFHHEFSHCLFENYKKNINKKEWKKFCLKKYHGKIWEMIRTNSNMREFSPDLYSTGFLNLYATINMKEDFASFAENMFLKDAVFWKAVSENNLLHQKLILTIGFYKKLNPNFDEKYFEKNNTVK